MKKTIKILFVICVCLIFALAGCRKKEKSEVLIQGRTMGTTFHIKIITDKDTSDLQKAIKKRLIEINKSMSIFDPASEISRFNAMTRVNKKFPVSDDFYKVMTVAKKLYGITGGAWDGTVGPLVNLWGFGIKKRRHSVPEKVKITKTLENVGFNHITIYADKHLSKDKPKIFLDLGSIAKGYGVDQIADLISKWGCGNFLVEIGGEIYASGARLDGKSWKIGINKPSKDAGFDEVYKVVPLKDGAFATSGDYRNFFEVHGKHYSHVIDPKTGYAVSNRVVSVSVMAGNCTFADGLATAIMVMGHKKGLKLVNSLNNVECLIVVRQSDGNFKDYYSKGFNVQS